MQYTVSAVMEPQGEDKGDTIEAQHSFIMKQVDPAFDPQVQKGIAKLKAMGCMSKGQGTVSTKLDKGLYHSDESVRLLADIDNTAAKADCKQIQMNLV